MTGKHALSLSKGSFLRAGTGLLTSAYGVGFALQALYFILLARALEASGLGTFAAALAVVSILAPFSGWGAGNILVMAGARDPHRITRHLGTALVAIGSTGSVLSLAALVIGYRLLPDSIVPLLLPLALSELIVGRVVDLASQVFQARDEYRKVAGLVVVSRLARLATLLVVVALPGTLEPEAWAWGYLCATTASAVGAALVVVASVGLPVFDRREFRVLQHGGSFAVGSASKTIYSDIDKIMLSRISGVEAAGIYTAAYRVISLAFTPIQAYVYAANTTLYRVGADGCSAVWRECRHVLPRLLIYAGAIGILIAILAPLTPRLLGASFSASVMVLILLAPLPALQAMHYLAGDALMGTGRQRERSLMQLGIAVLNVVLNLWLISAYSWTGAAVATLTCEGLLAAMSLALLWRLSALGKPARRVIQASS